MRAMLRERTRVRAYIYALAARAHKAMDIRPIISQDMKARASSITFFEIRRNYRAHTARIYTPEQSATHIKGHQSISD